MCAWIVRIYKGISEAAAYPEPVIVDVMAECTAPQADSAVAPDTPGIVAAGVDLPAAPPLTAGAAVIVAVIAAATAEAAAD